MKTRILFLLMVAGLNAANAQELTATEIIRKADNKTRGLSSQGTMTMTVIRPDWTRTITMKTWSKGRDYSLVLITAPAKDKGQVFLKIRTEMWNWVPSIDKTIKIPPSMMLQSWMGSDFTNDDLVKQSSIVVDYTHKLLNREKVREMECYKIELIPLPDAAVVWGKVIMWVTVNGYDTWMVEYYDEDNKLVNISNNYDIRQMGDREIPTRLEMIPQNKKGQKTVMHIDEMKFNTGVDESFFSQQNMKKIK
ncbi:MAG: outer membrane lipoprotein-sorting protein [Bacteroidetes bacterium]|nr:outer membrane lipoprotein-sorting protein [Bacteroidota bacterium]